MPETEPKRLGLALDVKQAEVVIGKLEQRFTGASIGFVAAGDRTFDLTVRSSLSDVTVDLLAAHAREVLEQKFS